MSSENLFSIMQQAKSLARVSYSSFLYVNELDWPCSIFAWLFEKAIDLVDGIIKLHQSNLDECSQALIRVLFETYLKYIHTVNLMKLTGQDEATVFIIESIVLLKEKK